MQGIIRREVGSNSGARLLWKVWREAAEKLPIQNTIKRIFTIEEMVQNMDEFCRIKKNVPAN